MSEILGIVDGSWYTMLAHKESLVVEVVVLPVSLLFAQEIFCYSTIFAGWHQGF